MLGLLSHSQGQGQSSGRALRTPFPAAHYGHPKRCPGPVLVGASPGPWGVLLGLRASRCAPKPPSGRPSHFQRDPEQVSRGPPRTPTEELLSKAVLRDGSAPFSPHGGPALPASAGHVAQSPHAQGEDLPSGFWPGTLNLPGDAEPGTPPPTTGKRAEHEPSFTSHN